MKKTFHSFSLIAFVEEKFKKGVFILIWVIECPRRKGCFYSDLDREFQDNSFCFDSYMGNRESQGNKFCSYSYSPCGQGFLWCKISLLDHKWNRNEFVIVFERLSWNLGFHMMWSCGNFYARCWCYLFYESFVWK